VKNARPTGRAFRCAAYVLLSSRGFDRNSKLSPNRLMLDRIHGFAYRCQCDSCYDGVVAQPPVMVHVM
ncbi:MAG: hypothetical protein P8L32_05195, partial [Paracoccaceae bacterium]|nr:hypothetical protein [Paracoccaceae bacterium]